MIKKLFALIFVAFALLACEQTSNVVKVTASFENPSEKKSTANFILEIADTPKRRAMGLMYRRDLPENQGMIFVFPDQAVRSFWMKNTYISLDMLFIDDQEKIVGIIESVPILNEAQRSVNIPSKYVVELVAGSTKKHNIRVGDKMKLSKELSATN